MTRTEGVPEREGGPRVPLARRMTGRQLDAHATVTDGPARDGRGRMTDAVEQR